MDLGSAMKKQCMTVLAFIGPSPRHRKQHPERGIVRHARVDPAAEITIVPARDVDGAYGRRRPQFRHRVVRDRLSGEIREVRTVPLTLGVRTMREHWARTSTDCIVGEGLDLPMIANDVLSQLGLKVTFDYARNKAKLETYDWRSFEEEVASIYRALGAHVEEDVNIGGSQLDVLVEEKTPSGQTLRIAVECKFHKRAVGVGLVNEFANVIKVLKTKRDIHRGVLVSSYHFTKEAWLAARGTDVVLLTIADLRQIALSRGARSP